MIRDIYEKKGKKVEYNTEFRPVFAGTDKIEYYPEGVDGPPVVIKDKEKITEIINEVVGSEKHEHENRSSRV